MKALHLLPGVLALHIILIAPMLAQPFGGFHGMSEAYFSGLGESLLGNPLTYPTRLDASTQVDIPVLPYLLYASYSLFGVGELQARIIPCVFSIASVALTYLIGKRVKDEWTGLTASLIYAVTPMQALVGRNLQPDPVYVGFGLAGLWLFLGRERHKHLLAGLFFALSFLAKQPGILFLFGVWVFSAFERERVDAAKYSSAVTACVFAPYAAYNLIFHKTNFLSHQLSRVGLFASAEGAGNGWGAVFFESMWGLSPLFFAGFLFCLAYSVKKKENRFALAFSVLFLLFFVVYNKHGYYVLPLAPFAALLLASCTKRLEKKRAALLLCVIVVFAFAQSSMLLCAKKYGYTAFADVGGMHEPGANILVSELISGNYIDLVRYYNPESNIVELGGLGLDEGDLVEIDYSLPTYSLIHYSEVDYGSLSREHKGLLAESAVYSERYAPSILGLSVYADPLNIHFFTPGDFHVTCVNGSGYVQTTSYAQLYLVRISEGERVYAGPGGSYRIREKI